MPTDPESNGDAPAAPDARIEDTPAEAPSPDPPRSRPAAKTAHQRAEEKRQEKLDLVRQQQESGSLVIRPMTDEERRRYPPRPVQPKQGRRR